MRKEIKFEDTRVKLDRGKEFKYNELSDTKRIQFTDRHEKLLKIISRNGICPILFTLERQPMKFSELMFETRLNPGVVDRHLKILTELGVIKREDNKYGLTESGKELIPVIEEFLTIMEKL